MGYIEKLKAGGIKFQKAVWETTKKGILKGGPHVSEKQYQERLSKCEGCEYSGTVYPLGTKEISESGCTVCGCPFVTKAKMLKIGASPIKCPHPEGNKWETVDQKYKSNERESH